MTRPPIQHVPPDRAAKPVLQEERDGDGLGWALAWCVAVGLGLVVWGVM